MTTPAGAQPPQTPPGWEVLAERALAILAIEKAAMGLTAPLRASLRGVMRATMTAWVREFGGIDKPSNPLGLHTVITVALGELHLVDPGDFTGRLRTVADRALTTGVRQAIEHTTLGQVPGADDLHRDDLGGLGDVIGREIDGAGARIADRLAAAERHITALPDGAGWSDMSSGVLRAHSAVTSAEATAGWVVNAAANRGSALVADALGVRRVWIAERNACRVCLALSGHLCDEAGEWDAAATFGTDPAPGVWPAGPLTGPPRHPHCRCRTEPWLGTAPGWTGVDLPAALRREAQRSILTGWRLPSEPESARLEAARALLDRGSGLPKSVTARARKAVERGRFGQFPRQPRPKKEPST